MNTEWTYAEFDGFDAVRVEISLGGLRYVVRHDGMPIAAFDDVDGLVEYWSRLHDGQAPPCKFEDDDCEPCRSNLHGQCLRGCAALWPPYICPCKTVEADLHD